MRIIEASRQESPKWTSGFQAAGLAENPADRHQAGREQKDGDRRRRGALSPRRDAAEVGEAGLPRPVPRGASEGAEVRRAVGVSAEAGPDRRGAVAVDRPELPVILRSSEELRLDADRASELEGGGRG